ncbi:HAD family hydrolase [Bacillus thuringiensis]|uniref:D-glycero-alpha-D-manno-heptose-1,7-bisphosphate 7-phosphatase n=1 Tax=Bacillus thuringiensis TaxID=1428 RepID=UPI00333C0011
MRKKAIFLDRDGVINKMWNNTEHGIIDSPLNINQFEFFPRVFEAVRMLNKQGFLIVVVSNQPVVAKGKTTPMLLEEITKYMLNTFLEQGCRIDDVYYCLHHPNAIVEKYKVHCSCRKPKPGLILKACKNLDIDPSQSYMIGDGITDVEAGKLAGCKTIWIGNWKCDICQISKVKPDFVAKDLYEASKIININGGKVYENFS